jgi:hypothetical protein
MENLVTSGTDDVMHRILKGFDSERLLWISRANESQPQRIAAGLELVERTADPRVLMELARNPCLPDNVRKAAGEKAVDLKEDLQTLIDRAQELELPVSVKTAAGLKAIHLAVKQDKHGLLGQLRYPMVPDEVLNVLDALKKPDGRERNPLAADGLLLKTGIRAPPAGKDAGQSKVRTR